jgi:glycogen debranching enzyme
MLRLVNILDGNTFVVSDTHGDFDATPNVPLGFFSFDTRFLSKWVLTVNGDRLFALGTDDLQYYEARFFLVPGKQEFTDATVSLIRHRWIAESFHEQLTLLNHGDRPADLTVRLEVAGDFADVFEIKGEPNVSGERYSRIEERMLYLGYRRGNFCRETLISSTEPATIAPDSFTFTVQLEPHGQWETGLRVRANAPAADGRDVRSGLRHRGRPKEHKQAELRQWLDQAPKVRCDWDAVELTYRRSIVDLDALKFTPVSLGKQALPAAGLPWFMTIFGRDSILTSLQALPFTATYAATTIQLLADLQGSRLDDFRDEEPGKILHEIRYGETSAFLEQPHSPYYGTADATALWLILLDEYERWTGDARMVHALEHEARAALAWIDTYADMRGDGYVWYQRRNEETGLENQCWKDSWDAISYSDGRLPRFPRATCELQGYAYDAKMRAARLARTFWNDAPLADRLETEAAELKERFNRDFWIADRGYYALALDGDGNQVDALSSNIGHLLWSGIIDESRAQQVVDHLLGPKLFSGWGVRTLATDAARYNPIGYHTGTVWPFDNSFIAWGLRRYRFRNEAAQVSGCMTSAAKYFSGRLPEAFAGYHIDQTRYPVRYPTACSPQAWSTGAPLLFIRAMLGLEPVGDNLLMEPLLPEEIGKLEVLDIPGRWGRMDAIGRGRPEEPGGPRLCTSGRSDPEDPPRVPDQ